MTSMLKNGLFAFAGDTFVYSKGTSVQLIRIEKDSIQFNLPTPVEWIKIAPNGTTILIYCSKGMQVWRWREKFGLDIFAEATNSRSIPGCGFIKVDGLVLTLLAQSGTLKGFFENGDECFVANLRSPYSFQVTNFVPISEDRIALTGSFFSDYFTAMVTVNINDLIHNPEAIQQAIRTKTPVWDRAITIISGPCISNNIVVFRDPQDEEKPEDEGDEADMGDVENFLGVYIRDINSGILIEKHPYFGKIGNGAAILATVDLIAIQVFDGIDIINRKSGSLHTIPSAILDVAGLQIIRVDQNNIKAVQISIHDFHIA